MDLSTSGPYSILGNAVTGHFRLHIPQNLECIQWRNLATILGSTSSDHFQQCNGQAAECLKELLRSVEVVPRMVGGVLVLR